MSERKTSVPKRRFPEFTAAAPWEEKSIGPYLVDCSGRTSSDTELPIYSSTRDGLKRQDAYFDGKVLQNSNDYGVVPPGCFVYRHMSDDGLFKFNINNTGSNIAVSKEYPVFKAEGLNPNFLLPLLNEGRSFRQFAYSQKAGGTRTRLYFSRLREWQTALPSSAEQQKIADCLSSLDGLIAGQLGKVEVLEDHRKALMQRLFPNRDETRPRVRLPEFISASNWKTDTLAELCTAKISYGIIQAGPHVPGGLPYIKSSDLNSPLRLNSLARTSDSIAAKYRRSEVVPGDLVFSLRGNIGASQIVPQDIQVANLTQGTARIRPEGVPKFYMYALRSQAVNERIQAAAKGSTFQEISIGALRAIQMSRPEIAEQQRIAELLSSLDSLIAAAVREVQELKTHKMGLMRQLFPSTDALDA